MTTASVLGVKTHMEKRQKQNTIVIHPKQVKENDEHRKWQQRVCLENTFCLESVSRWTLLEELALIQIVQSSLTAAGSDINIDVIAMQYSQLVDNSGIHPKSQAQISGKVISFMNDDRVYKALLKEQVRLNCVC